MMWFEEALTRIKSGDHLVIVTVAQAKGSSPRDTGAKMLVGAETVFGTIGGGALELMAIERARELLSKQDVKRCAVDYPLGPDIGQCCGGHMRLTYEHIDVRDTAWLEAWQEAAGRPELTVFRTDLTSSAAPEIPRSGGGASAEPARLQEEAGRLFLYETVFDHRRPVWIFGGGHVAQALVAALAPLDFKLHVVDERPQWLEQVDQAKARTHLNLVPESHVAAIERGAVILVMTHSHGRDFDIVEASLRRDDLGFVGMIGSATKKARCLNQLRMGGLSQDKIDGLQCPIGVPGIDGKNPAAIAVSVAAQLLQICPAVSVADLATNELRQVEDETL